MGDNPNKFGDESVYGSMKISSWADMKEFDDDHDKEWFKDENARLAEQYGGTFVYAKYLDSQPGKVGYYCELCYAEMNARKSLELHCSGMKHLKKKDMWEKNQQQGGDGQNSGAGNPEPPPPPSSRRQRSPPRRRPRYSPPMRDRSPPPDYRYDPYDRYREDMYRRDRYYDGERRWGSPGGRDRRGGRYTPDRRDMYERRDAPPPPVISDPSGGRLGPMFHTSTDALFEGIADGSCSELLKRLAVCRVNNEDDCLLAMNVANFLVIELRDYFRKAGPSTVTHVIEDVISKINIVKELMKVNPPGGY